MARLAHSLALASLAALLAALPAAADEPVRKISVNASVTNEVPVTNVHYYLNVELVRPTLAEAKKEVDAAVTRLRERLKVLPATELIFQDSRLEQGRRYKDERELEPVIVGYFVRRSLTLELKDFSLADRLETILAESEEFRLNYRSFSNTDEIRLRHESRKSALEAAQRKAKSMAEVLNMTIGAPIEISEGESNSFTRYYGESDLDLPFRQGSFGRERRAEGNTVTIGAEVRVVFELKTAP